MGARRRRRQRELQGQPLQTDTGPAHQEGQLGSIADGAFARQHGAANQGLRDTGPGGPAPSPRPRSWFDDTRARIGAGVLAGAALLAGGWWTLQPRIEISRVETAGVLVGNSRPQPVFIDFGSQPWAQNERAQTIKLPADSTQFAYRFEAFGKPTKSTLEFTLVDAAGVRSDPVRVALNVGVVAAPGSGLGTVVSVRQAAAAPKEGNGLGAVLGGIVGAITGNQAGKGSGRAVATIAGAAGGAWVGNEIEKRAGSNPNTTYETTVRFDAGQTRVISTRGLPPWREGTRAHWNGRELSPGGR